jgi:hypothetical protein
MGYGLDGRGSIPSRTRNFSLFWSVQTGSGTNIASNEMGTGRSSLGAEAGA